MKVHVSSAVVRLKSRPVLRQIIDVLWVNPARRFSFSVVVVRSFAVLCLECYPPRRQCHRGRALVSGRGLLSQAGAPPSRRFLRRGFTNRVRTGPAVDGGATAGACLRRLPLGNLFELVRARSFRHIRLGRFRLRSVLLVKVRAARAAALPPVEEVAEDEGDGEEDESDEEEDDRTDPHAD